MSLALALAAATCLAATPFTNVREFGPLKVVIGGTPLSLKHEGQLKDVLEKIAEAGGLNVVIVGDLSEPARLHLTSVTAEEALESVAKVYDLDVQREGKMWVVRKRAATAPVTSANAASVKERAHELKEEAKAQALSLKEEAKSLAQELKEEAKSIKEQTQDEIEAAKEEAEAAREEAEEARQQAEEIRAEAQERAEEARARADEVRARIEEAHALTIHSGPDRVSAGGDVVVEAGTTVDKAVAYGGDVVVEEGARVTDDAVAFGGNVTIKDGATIDGDAVAFGGEVRKGDGATVRGQTVSFGGDEMGTSIARGAMKARHQARRDDGDFGGSVAAFLLQFALLFGLGFLATMFVPNRMKQLETTVRKQPVRNGLVGLLAAIALVPLTVLLTVTIVGIPVVVALWIIIAPLAALLGVVVIANAVGLSLPTGRMHRTQALVLALGLLAVLLVARIPVAGPIAMTVAGLVAVGAMVRTRFGQPPRGVPLPDTQGDSLPQA